jgi:DNA recombination-dependent growth factor C
MPFLSGSISFREYKVEGSFPPNYRKTFEESLERYKFTPPRPAHLEMRSIGWVNPRNLLNDELIFPHLLIADYMFLALRVDRLSLNIKLFKAQLKERMTAKAKEIGKKRLSKADREAMTEALKREILEKTSPTTNIYEAVWHLEKKRVFFGSSSEKLNAEFADIFEECFDLALIPLFTYFRAKDWAEANGKDSELDLIAPSGGML